MSALPPIADITVGSPKFARRAGVQCPFANCVRDFGGMAQPLLTRVVLRTKQTVGHRRSAPKQGIFPDRTDVVMPIIAVCDVLDGLRGRRGNTTGRG